MVQAIQNPSTAFGFPEMQPFQTQPDWHIGSLQTIIRGLPELNYT